MKLRSHLLVLIAATLVPVSLFAIGGAYLLAERERDAFRQGATERVRALMTAIDAELRGAVSSLEALAALPVFDGEDLEAFRPIAQRLLPTQPGWLTIIVSRADGTQALNLLVPAGKPLPPPGDPESVLKSAASGHSVIGNLSYARLLDNRPTFTARTPVVRDGRVKYIISAGIDAQAIRRLLDDQGFPPGWFAAVIDGQYRFIARTRVTPGSGPDISDSLRHALSEKGEGWEEGRTLEGLAVHRAFIRSAYSGWSTSMAIPSGVIQRSAVQAAWLLAFGVLLAIAAAMLVALLLARRITRPIAGLAAAAPQLGAVEPAVVAESQVDEVRELSQALRLAGRAIREREEELRAADRAKDEFLAMLSHELRNPLATLMTSAELLKIGRGQPGIVDNAQQLIARQTAHMAHLVDDLLEVSRVTSGKIRLEREPLNLAECATRVLRTWRTSGRLERHQVTESLAPVWADADAARIEQIVSNLLDNALKYTPPGGHITVGVRAEASDALIEVADDGEGIDAELIGRVFDLFVQGERSLARERGGLGIGLTLVKRLAELHGGSASASSAGRGRGSRFTVRLPAVAAPLARAGVRDAAGDGARRRRVLLVEDNADARHSLAELLRLLGHDVTLAANADEALRAAAATEQDIALVDIGLPDMDGYELAARLRRSARGGKLALVALTGYGKEEDRARALAVGFDEHLTKPVALDRLEHLLAQDLRRAA